MTHVHLVGIGGSGLSAIARLLKESGYDVTGSDQTLSPFAAELQNIGVQIYVGHHPRNISGAELVIRSSAIKDENPEVRAALQAGIPVYKRSDFLGSLMETEGHMGNVTGIFVATCKESNNFEYAPCALLFGTLKRAGNDPANSINLPNVIHATGFPPADFAKHTPQVLKGRQINGPEIGIPGIYEIIAAHSLFYNVDYTLFTVDVIVMEIVGK